MAKSKVQRLVSLQKTIHGSYGFWGADELKDAVEDALKQSAPQGNPYSLRTTALVFGQVASQVDVASTEFTAAGQRQLPDIWVGTAGTKAAEVVCAAGTSTQRIGEQIDRGARTLSQLADAIESAQSVDATGRGPLEHARQLLAHSTGWTDYDGDKVKQAHQEAMAGIDALVRAAQQAEHAGETAARDLHQNASQAHASKLRSPAMSAADALVIADAAIPGGPHDDNLILTGAQASRAGDLLNRMNSDDQARFNALLHDAKSPQERAYLLKALAAGYNIKQIEQFDSKIHKHGDDPGWLAEHLTPIVDNGNRTENQHHDMWYDGRSWTQGSDPTCVASSLVTARAQVDPLYTLELTTGGHPDDPAFDNGDAFAKRLKDQQHDVYDSGRGWDADLPLFGYDGMTDQDADRPTADVLGKPQGTTYQSIDMDNASERRAVVPDIERAVDDGRPVPFTADGDGGHGMVIVGHDGDMLEIYNPWGYTVWVSEDEFINGQLDKVDGGLPPHPDNVRIPR